MADTAPQPELQLYLKQINQIPLLSPEEEKELGWRIINENDHEAKDRMIKANLRLVVSISKNYSHRGLPLADLMGPGTRGELVGGYAGSQVDNLVDRVAVSPADLPGRAWTFVSSSWPSLLGGTVVDAGFVRQGRAWMGVVLAAFGIAGAGRIGRLLHAGRSLARGEQSDHRSGAHGGQGHLAGRGQRAQQDRQHGCYGRCGAQVGRGSHLRVIADQQHGDRANDGEQRHRLEPNRRGEPSEATEDAEHREGADPRHPRALLLVPQPPAALGPYQQPDRGREREPRQDRLDVGRMRHQRQGRSHGVFGHGVVSS